MNGVGASRCSEGGGSISSPLEILSSSPEETRELGRRLGELAGPGDVYLLTGQLGAGKTCLTQGIAWGLGIEEYAASPSFVVVREYRGGRLPLYHVDLYRLNRLAEVVELGLDDYLYGQGVCVVEWADRALEAMPGEYLMIEIERLSQRRRCLRLQPRGQRYEELACRWLELRVGQP